MPEDATRTSVSPHVQTAAAGGLDDHGLVPGTVIAGRFRIASLIGRGGMGEVYQAEDLKLRQLVALKFLPAGLAQDIAALARFHNEVQHCSPDFASERLPGL